MASEHKNLNVLQRYFAISLWMHDYYLHNFNQCNKVTLYIFTWHNSNLWDDCPTGQTIRLNVVLIQTKLSISPESQVLSILSGWCVYGGTLTCWGSVQILLNWCTKRIDGGKNNQTEWQQEHLQREQNTHTELSVMWTLHVMCSEESMYIDNLQTAHFLLSLFRTTSGTPAVLYL